MLQALAANGPHASHMPQGRAHAWGAPRAGPYSHAAHTRTRKHTHTHTHIHTLPAWNHGAVCAGPYSHAAHTRTHMHASTHTHIHTHTHTASMEPRGGLCRPFFPCNTHAHAHTRTHIHTHAPAAWKHGGLCVSARPWGVPGIGGRGWRARGCLHTWRVKIVWPEATTGKTNAL